MTSELDAVDVGSSRAELKVEWVCLFKQRRVVVVVLWLATSR